MGAGKVLILIGALLTLVSTFFLTLFSTGGTQYGSGIGFLFNIPEIMEDADSIAIWLGTETMIVYIVTIVFIVFLISGILQLVGLVSRIVAIIGSVIVLGISIVLILGLFDILPDFFNFLVLLARDAIVEDVWPYDISLIGGHLSVYLSLGTITLLAGGALGLVGGIIGTSDF